MKIELVQGGTAFRVSEFNAGLPKRILQECIRERLTIEPDNFYLVQNGRRISDDSLMDTNLPVMAVPCILGGKGGFGSMLRAIGAQIEKTTNRDACRDLSGRRLRDINEEQRLKRWFSKEGERDEEKAELRKQKLERMRKICEGPPLPKTEDRAYNQQRADMAESVYEAVDKGFEASTSSSSKPSTSTASATVTSASSSDSSNSETEMTETTEEPTISTEPAKPKEAKKKDVRKIKKTMFDEDLDSDVSSSESEDEIPPKKMKVA